ncbi:3'-5' exonuclease [Sphingobacterium bovistauri]|uniref:3'-5' exonuclease n=1 Tax=Sphingobacterium bovistauri TaxID=2781959 RepID=A0ABS7Z771_9SPHI|nr:3'-5' exonuclease [Sphingobacterium bovistauri]MCA5005447.1 3'-5' exonuclease [Sphingobacterium bovistauri]
MIKSHYMFLDTEASGEPVSWDVSSVDCRDWPYLVQISWVIYTIDGDEIKREKLYIDERDFKSTSSALKIHKITDVFRQQHGSSRKDVLNRLLMDLQMYDPLLVCHFLKFDLNLLKFELERAAIKYNLDQIPAFCTLMATRYLAGTAKGRSLTLSQLYAILFYKTLQNYHDALCDTLATAECFFELSKSGYINEQSILEQINERKMTIILK